MRRGSTNEPPLATPGLFGVVNASVPLAIKGSSPFSFAKWLLLTSRPTTGPAGGVPHRLGVETDQASGPTLTVMPRAAINSSGAHG